jgi:hypothetical protein
MLERLEHLIAHTRSEYMEMPGQRLSVIEAGRLWGIEQNLAETILQALVDEGFLKTGADGKFGRPTDSPQGARPRQVRSSVRDERREFPGKPGGRRADER